MKNIGKINKLILSACVALVFFGGILVSCTYDESDQVGSAGDSFIRIVSSVDGASGFFSGIAAFDASGENTQTFLEIRRDAVDAGDLGTSVTASFVIDNTIVDDYNHGYVDSYNAGVNAYNDSLDANGIDYLAYQDTIPYYTALDPSVYSFATTTVTFNAGEFAVYIPMTLDPATLSFEKQFALGARLVDPSGKYKVSEIGKEIFVKVIVKNQYDGDYHSLGGFGHPSSPRPIDRDKTLATRGATSFEMELGDLGGNGYTFILEVQPDNSVIILNKLGSPASTKMLTEADEAAFSFPGVNDLLHPWSYYDNKYHPETDSFRFRYAYVGGSGPRTTTEEVTRK